MRLLSVFCLFFAVQTSGAEKRGTFGGYLSIHGDPPPAMIGLNAGLNLGVFRVTAGAGSYTTLLSNVPSGLLNYTIMPLGFAFVWIADVIGQFFTKGKVDTHRSYALFRNPYEEVETIYTYGGALKLVPLKTALSPLVGIGYARFETSGSPFGFPDSKSFVYFPVGLDYSNGGFNLGLGYNITPAIGQRASGIYANLGVLF